MKKNQLGEIAFCIWVVTALAVFGFWAIQTHEVTYKSFSCPTEVGGPKKLVSPSDHPLTKCSKRFSEGRGEFQAIVP